MKKNYISPGSAAPILNDPSIPRLLNETAAQRDMPLRIIGALGSPETSNRELEDIRRPRHARGDSVEREMQETSRETFKKGGRGREMHDFGDFVSGVGNFVRDYGPMAASFAPLLLKEGGRAKASKATKKDRSCHAAGGAGKVRKGEYY